MVTLEQLEFQDLKSLKEALSSQIKGEEVFQSYTDSDGNKQKKKIISNNRAYTGNNYSVSIIQSQQTGKAYLKIEYFSVEDRIKVAQNKKEEQGQKQENTNNKDYNTKDLEF